MPLLPLKVAMSGSTGSGVFLSMHSMYFQLFTQISCLVSVVLVLSQWRRVRHKGLWDVNEWEQKCNLLDFGSLLVYTKEKWIQSSLIVSGNPAGFDGCHPNIPTLWDLGECIQICPDRQVYPIIHQHKALQATFWRDTLWFSAHLLLGRKASWTCWVIRLCGWPGVA